jgi:AraC family transcriptional regulator
MSLTTRALWVIDRNLARDLTLAEVAQSCGVSRHHLAHAFGEATGCSVMTYVRGRRLSEAARALAAGASNILDLALESGYASHEAFTRAFRARFGASPEQVRQRGMVDGLSMVEPIRGAESPGPAIASPRFETAGDIVAVGLRTPCGFDDLEAIPTHWRRFGPFFAGIPDKADPIPVGVMTAVDEDGGFDYVCAAQVTGLRQAPAGFSKLRITAQAYAVFEHAGHVSGLRGTYAAIWNRWLPDSGRAAADAPSLERHHPSFDPRTGLGGLDLWIPLRV